jgi:uncharacterized SAM-binding protein YcdF (DUF218 family)
MQALSEKTLRLVERLFPFEQLEAARHVLIEECGTNLPFSETLGAAGVERVRFAVLKLSDGDLTELRAMAGHATVDWRDVLVWAGFGESLAAHGKWARTLLESRHMNDRVRVLAETIWRYHQLNHELSAADAILVLCSYDLAVAERGAQLFLEGWAPLLIFSGGLGAITKRFWKEPEADQFAAIAARMGVPPEKILIENRSTNTGENVLFTKQLLAEKQIDPAKFILVQKPYMERRGYATFRKLWPGKEVVVTSPKVSFEGYLSRYSNPALSADEVISIMVGDLQRIRLYPAKGFQIEQDIPADVWAAFEELVDLGYDKHLISNGK